MADDTFIAVGLLTETNIRMLGSSLKRVFPIPRDDRFDTLISALDEMCAESRSSR